MSLFSYPLCTEPLVSRLRPRLTGCTGVVDMTVICLRVADIFSFQNYGMFSNLLYYASV